MESPARNALANSFQIHARSLSPPRCPVNRATLNSTAQVYNGELASDAALQLLEMGFGKPKNRSLQP
jgi:hypothetical protein